jgi:hypothetical protein
LIGKNGVENTLFSLKKNVFERVVTVGKIAIILFYDNNDNNNNPLYPFFFWLKKLTFYGKKGVMGRRD